MELTLNLNLLIRPLLLICLSVPVCFSEDIESLALGSLLKFPSLNDIGSIDYKCHQCKDAQEIPAEDNLYCNDIYANSCLKPDGSSKYQNEYQHNLSLLQDKLKESRDLAAKEMGFEDFNAALKSKIADAGIPMPDRLTDSQINQLLQENSVVVRSDDIKYPDIDSCEEKNFSDSIKKSSLGFNLDNSKSSSKYLNKINKFKKRKIELSILDLPNFLLTEYSGPCGKLKTSADEYPAELNYELTSKCREFPKIRQEAVEIFRLENTPVYTIKASEFVRNNLLPPLQKKISIATQITSEEIEQNRLRDQAGMVCYDLKNYLNAAAQKLASSLASDLARSKPLIDNMIRSYYNDNRKEKSQELLNFTKENIKKMLPKITENSKKIKIISTGYDNLQLAWLEKPKASEYEKNARTGLMSLKENDGMASETAIAFSDTKLSYFTDINAFYTAQIMEGDEVAEVDKVHMMPFFIKQLDDNKYNFLAVLAHEAGHKIGPDVSRYNGHDLREEWKKLMSCYKGSDSIGLIDRQKDEVIADYISAEILAGYLHQLPASERRAALSSAMSDFCLFNDSNNCNYSMSSGHTHPENILRINGVYGATPRLREVVGCKEPGAKYRSCSL